MLLRYSQTFKAEDAFLICICCQPTVLVSPGPELTPAPSPSQWHSQLRWGFISSDCVTPGLNQVRSDLKQTSDARPQEEGRSFCSEWLHVSVGGSKSLALRGHTIREQALPRPPHQGAGMTTENVPSKFNLVQVTLIT